MHNNTTSTLTLDCNLSIGLQIVPLSSFRSCQSVASFALLKIPLQVITAKKNTCVAVFSNPIDGTAHCKRQTAN